MTPLANLHVNARLPRRWLRVIAPTALGLLFLSSLAQAQVSAPARPQGDYLNSASFDVSYGVVNGRDADFWGWSVAYSRRFKGAWAGAVALMWDRETENKIEGPDTEVDSYTASATISYAITENVSLATGLGKGFANTDNASQSMKFKSGDLSTGIVVGYSFPGPTSTARDSVVLSLAYEYNISEKETMVSLDAAFGWSF